jgi:hypothetical protein
MALAWLTFSYAAAAAVNALSYPEQLTLFLASPMKQRPASFLNLSIQLKMFRGGFLLFARHRKGFSFAVIIAGFCITRHISQKRCMLDL